MDKDCKNQISSLRLDTLSSDVALYYKDPVTGYPTLTVTDSSQGGLGSASCTVSTEPIRGL